MSGPNDTEPPPSGPRTSPELPGPIPTGKAHLAVTAGFLEVLSAVARLEAVCAAVARQLDATTTEPTT